ncbi:MAG: hypothetical protein QOJ03_956 [Frankiaceae bacterium]|nr:hypothetical protein [Frankiaceae bacterium]
MRRRRGVLIAFIAAAFAALMGTGGAATPSSGHLGPSHRSLSYTTVIQAGNIDGLVVGLEGVFTCPPASQDPADALCDHYALSVDVPPSYWDTHHGGVQIVVPADFFGYAYTPANTLAASSGWTGKAHVMTIPNASGRYEIRLAPYFAFGTSKVTAAFVSAPGADKVLHGHAFTAYHGLALSRQPKKKPANHAIPYHGPKLAFRATYVHRGAAEPTIGVDKRGAAFFVAAAFDALPDNPAHKNEPRTVVLRSTDQNKSWHSVQPPLVAGTGDGQPATLDPYVYVDRDYGRVFDIDLALAGSYLSYSDDEGKTWNRGAAISVFGANDHQTLFAGPPTAGLKTVDPAFPKILYYCVNQIDGSYCSRSLDGGRTFTNTGTPVFPPADAQPQNGVPFCGGLHGHGVTDSKGRAFMPRGFCGAPELAISADAGTTWNRVNIDKAIKGNGASNIGAQGIQDSIAVDTRDNLYYVWYDDTYKLPYLSISTDHGKSWTRPRMIAPPGVQAVDFPTIDAGTPGRIAITFPGTRSKDDGDITRPWNSYVVESVNALSSRPTFLSVVANRGGLADPIHRGDCDGRCGRMYDFLDIVRAPDVRGTIWATATDTCTTQAFCNTRRVAGYAAATGEHGASDSRDGVVYRQVSGPPLMARRK